MSAKVSILGYCHGIWTLKVYLLLNYQHLNKGCPYTIVEDFRGGKQLMLYNAYVLQLHSVKDRSSEIFALGTHRLYRFSWQNTNFNLLVKVGTALHS